MHENVYVATGGKEGGNEYHLSNFGQFDLSKCDNVIYGGNNFNDGNCWVYYVINNIQPNKFDIASYTNKISGETIKLQAGVIE